MGRFLNLLKGFWNRWIYGIEQRNPDIAYDNAIEAVLQSYAALKSKAGAVVRERDKLLERKNLCHKNLTSVTGSLEAAAVMDEDQVDLVAAAEAVKLQEQLTEEYNGIIGDLQAAEADVIDVKNALLEVESELRSLKTEKNTQIARYESAKARIGIQEMSNGTSISEARKSLEGVRENIAATIATAKLGKEMKDDSLESKVLKFQKATQGVSAQQKFLQMREAAKTKALGSSTQGSVLDAVVQEAKVGV
jgi:phage shock protein A